MKTWRMTTLATILAALCLFSLAAAQAQGRQGRQLPSAADLDEVLATLPALGGFLQGLPSGLPAGTVGGLPQAFVGGRLEGLAMGRFVGESLLEGLSFQDDNPSRRLYDRARRD
ncbi:MAG: hypothetical protein V3T83_06710, partial [Acidobacteriota bacterium]